MKRNRKKTTKTTNNTGYFEMSNIVKCVSCGKEVDLTGRVFKIMSETWVPTRIAPLRQPIYLCVDCEDSWLKQMYAGNTPVGISSSGTEMEDKHE